MERNLYLNKLIRKKNNGLIKVITGIRRSGKTYLLFELFYDYLIKSGVDKDHIIKIALDDRINKKYRDPDILCEYVHDVVKDDQIYYVLLDEVQMVSGFVERFPELSLFFKAYSPLDSEMICIFPYFCPYAESAREIREIFS